MLLRSILKRSSVALSPALLGKKYAENGSLSQITQQNLFHSNYFSRRTYSSSYPKIETGNDTQKSNMEVTPMPSFCDLSKIKLMNPFVTIRMMTKQDYDALSRQFDPELLKWFIVKYPDCRSFFDEKIKKYHDKESISYVVEENSSRTVIGTTSLYELDFKNKRLEMGATWFGRPFISQGYNPTVKLLLLEHLFETMGFNRVQWKTDSNNLVAKNSMLKMGCTYEGSLRYHTVTHTGRVRDSLVFSVIRPEWPSVKIILNERIKDKLDSRSSIL